MRARYITPLVVGCLLAGGCGGDDDAPTETAADTSTTPVAAAPDGLTTTTRSSATATTPPATSSGPDAAVRRYLRALTARDGEKACGELAEEARRQAIATAEASLRTTFSSCGPALTAVIAGVKDSTLKALEIEITKSEVTGDRAVVAVKGGDRNIELRKLDSRWYIAGGIG